MPSHPDRVDYSRDIRPILSDHCYACHGPDQAKRKAGLRLDQKEGAAAPLKSGARAIVPGKLEESELIRRITATDADDRMPPADQAKALSETQVNTLKRWVAEGAEWQGHWAYIKPERSGAPPVQDTNWAKGDLDRFVLAKLDERGLKPSPPAPKEKLLRRVSFDLTGLPPSPEELDAFLADGSADAYEKVVDRLLQSKQYGERQAMFWLDLARYGETQGYHHDAHRDMFHWRDWVINAYNRNLPFDQFTIEQLAGDLLPNPTREQLLATGFHRNEMTTSEGGAIPEEYAVKYVVGRVDTTARVWLGTSMACAECHDHKYDPITQKEYYQFFAFFNTTTENGMDQQPNPVPRLTLATPDHEKKLREFDQQIGALALAHKGMVEPPQEAHDKAQAEWERKHQDENIRPWTVLKPASVSARKGTTLVVAEDGAVSASGPSPDQDVYELHTPIESGGVTGFRVEALPGENKKSGRSDEGEFILTRVEAESRRHGGQPDQSWKPPTLGNWQSVGPFAAGSPHEAYEKQFGPESNLDFGGTYGDGKLKWSELNWKENEPQLLGGANAATYLYRSIYAPVEQECTLSLGSAGGLQLWLNWKRVFTNQNTRVFAAGQDQVRVQLKAGENQLLIKVVSAKDKDPFQFDLLDESEYWRPVEFSAAAADFNRGGYHVNGALDDRIETGWSVAQGDESGQPHVAWFRCKDALRTGSGFEVKLRLFFDAPVPRRTLSKFRVAVSCSAGLGDFFGLPDGIRVALNVANASEGQRAELRRYYRETFVSEAKELTQLLNQKRRERDEFQNSIPVAMIMREMEKPRETRLLVRGEYNNPGEPVKAGVPKSIFPITEEFPPNRLGLAKWLVHPDHPLTSRVAVNHYWQQFFGTGLVKTAEDFGSQGEWPSHPELLDWLAREFVSSGWNIKAMHRLMVTSAAYRQNSIVSEPNLDRDPEARWLSRFPRARLEAEAIRDQALAASGLIDLKVGGPSVYPYQPPGLWEQVSFEGTRSWEQGKGTDNYRRGLYVYWRRSVPYASFVTFDAPSRETCAVRRPRTNTPLQALALMNDPVYVEASRAFGLRIMRQGGAALPERIRYAFRVCLTRAPSGAEFDRLVAAYERELAHFEKNRAAANQLVHVGTSTPPVDVDICELAAWTVIANILFNLDETITKS